MVFVIDLSHVSLGNLMLPLPISIEPYTPAGRTSVLSLLRGRLVYRHLDWQSVEQWLDNPELVACLGYHVARPVAFLAIAPSSEGTGWLRIAAVQAGGAIQPVIRQMWAYLIPRAQDRGIQRVYALLQTPWMTRALTALGFYLVEEIVTLLNECVWQAYPVARRSETVDIRPAQACDLAIIQHIDQAAFEPQWRMSQCDLSAAWHEAVLFVVASVDEQPVSYALTFSYEHGSHLARIAVLPGYQGRGIGQAVFRHVLNQTAANDIRVMTVNTQVSNIASLRMYRSAGFQEVGYVVPVVARSIVD
jgi:ribosomal-protein-alanine N-acetyltransferase